MSWSIGFDEKWNRDIGYGVPAVCDHSECSEKIDRGLSYVCGSNPYGGEHGCGLYFCGKHLFVKEFGADCVSVCDRCFDGKPPFEPKPDVAEWIQHKLNDESWSEWREENPTEVQKMREQLNKYD